MQLKQYFNVIINFKLLKILFLRGKKVSFQNISAGIFLKTIDYINYKSNNYKVTNNKSWKIPLRSCSAATSLFFLNIHCCVMKNYNDFCPMIFLLIYGIYD